MDSAGSERAAIVGFSEGGSMALMFGATHPQRTQALIIVGSQARWTQTEDYPWGPTAEEYEAMLAEIRNNWPSMEYLFGAGAGMGEAIDPALRTWVLRWAQAGASPRAIVALEEMNSQIDVRDILPAIAVPTLVINRTGDVAALGGADEVLISGTVRDLIAGSGFDLADRGLHDLKGVEGARQIFAVK
jgi:pimeloyl-ACP methyl ester carboxylesterase